MLVFETVISETVVSKSVLTSIGAFGIENIVKISMMITDWCASINI